MGPRYGVALCVLPLRELARSKLRYSIVFEILWPIIKIFTRFWAFPAMPALRRLKKLVRWGITSISVNPDAIGKVRQTIAEAEKEVVGKK